MTRRVTLQNVIHNTLRAAIPFVSAGLQWALNAMVPLSAQYVGDKSSGTCMD